MPKVRGIILIAVFEEVTCTGTFAALKAAPFPFKGQVTAKITNGGNVTMRLAGTSVAGTDMTPGTIKRCNDPVDLASFEVKGNGFILILDGVYDKGWV